MILKSQQNRIELVNRPGEARTDCPGITCALLLSIDRRRPLSDALDTMEIFRKSDRDIVVGIDFSGDARCGDLADFLPILKKAQDEDGAKLAVHLGEVPNHGKILSTDIFGSRF